MYESIKENIQRVLGFLVSLEILIAPSEESSNESEREQSKVERVKLYEKSKEVIGVYWSNPI